MDARQVQIAHAQMLVQHAGLILEDLLQPPQQPPAALPAQAVAAPATPPAPLRPRRQAVTASPYGKKATATATASRTVSCGECGHACKGQTGLKIHKKAAHGKGCTVCKKSFKSKGTYEAHLVRKHRPRP